MRLFPKNRWYLELNCSHKEDIKAWKQTAKGCRLKLNSNFTQDKRNPNGQAYLHLLSPSADSICKNNNWQKYSSNVIKFTIHILAIILMDQESLIKLGDQLGASKKAINQEGTILLSPSNYTSKLM